MNRKIRWGILSTAKIAREKLIPAIQASEHNEVVAVASRTVEAASEFAAKHNIPLAFGDYQELLDSDQVDAIYNPLPNHLHVPWSIKAVEAGKHLLCEKPLGLDTADASKLVTVASRHPNLKVMEAFMYKFHPQWVLARDYLAAGKIGKITAIDAVFTYFNVDPKNVRNMPGIGGGGLLDVGCYCISAARYLLDLEPVRVTGTLNMDTDFQVDRHANGLLDFGDVTASIYCSTQSEPNQRVIVHGEHGSLTLEYPFYQPDNCPARLVFHHNREPEVIETEGCDHYVKQVDAVAHAILRNLPTPTPLSDALANMRVIDALFASHESGAWVKVQH